MPKVFITKYALTKGIIAVEAELVEGHASGVVYASTKRRNFSVFTRDFHLTEEAARADAEKKRKRKIAGLNKQIAKLLMLKIDVEQIKAEEG